LIESREGILDNALGAFLRRKGNLFALREGHGAGGCAMLLQGVGVFARGGRDRGSLEGGGAEGNKSGSWLSCKRTRLAGRGGEVVKDRGG
jgi:hypothetical protein